MPLASQSLMIDLVWGLLKPHSAIMYSPRYRLDWGAALKGHFSVLSDECELVSVWHECGYIMQHKVDATRREQRCVEV